MDLTFNVENQILEYKKEYKVVNLSNNYLKLFFNFNTDDWIDLNKFIILKNEDNEAYLFNYDENGVIVPSTVLNGRLFRVSAYGSIITGERITTNELIIRLLRSGYTTDISSVTDESVDVFITVTTRMDELEAQLNNKVNNNDVDNELNTESNNPISNSAVSTALNNIDNNIDEKSDRRIVNAADILRTFIKRGG